MDILNLMRNEKLDSIRGMFIIGMILFHTNFMLVNYFNIYYFENIDFWVNLQYYGKLGFLILSGITFSLAENKYADGLVQAYLKKTVRIGSLAGSVTLFSLVFAGQEPIFFGVLHYFAVSYLLLLIFRKLGYSNIIIGLMIILIGIYLESKHFGTGKFIILGLKPDGFSALDYFPLLPNFGYALLGYSAGRYLINKGKLSYFRYPSGFMQKFEVLGRRSLLVYFIHGPIIYSLIWLILSLIKDFEI